MLKLDKSFCRCRVSLTLGISCLACMIVIWTVKFYDGISGFWGLSFALVWGSQQPVLLEGNSEGTIWNKSSVVFPRVQKIPGPLFGLYLFYYCLSACLGLHFVLNTACTTFTAKNINPISHSPILCQALKGRNDFLCAFLAKPDTYWKNKSRWL